MLVVEINLTPNIGIVNLSGPMPNGIVTGHKFIDNYNPIYFCGTCVR